MKDPYSVIQYPLRTEKGVALQSKGNKYLFRVDRQANKLDVKKAVESIYKVKVAEVNMMNVLGKTRRVRLAAGKRPDWKKAIVTLQKGETIEIQ